MEPRSGNHTKKQPCLEVHGIDAIQLILWFNNTQLCWAV